MNSVGQAAQPAFRPHSPCPIPNTRLRERTVQCGPCPLTTENCHLSALSCFHHCCNTTWSPSFSPLRTSVTEPFDNPTVTGTLRLPSFCFLSGISTVAFFWLSYITAFSGTVSTPFDSSSRISALAVMLAFSSPPGLSIETRTSKVVTLSFRSEERRVG